MRQMGVICAMTMSIILDGYRLEWDPAKGPAPPVQLRNLASVKTDEGFVTRSVEAGVLSGIIQECQRKSSSAFYLWGSP